mmetsp:Transcript_20707/g.31617  ORF Transcript_20707/g.31617 Transcript_20707/m.31617 type:complete len:103 (+) Transcript_20707:41-349(+)
MCVCLFACFFCRWFGIIGACPFSNTKTKAMIDLQQHGRGQKTKTGKTLPRPYFCTTWNGHILHSLFAHNNHGASTKIKPEKNELFISECTKEEESTTFDRRS